jgi:hypothetical protein
MFFNDFVCVYISHLEKERKTAFIGKIKRKTVVCCFCVVCLMPSVFLLPVKILMYHQRDFHLAHCVCICVSVCGQIDSIRSEFFVVLLYSYSLNIPFLSFDDDYNMNARLVATPSIEMLAVSDQNATSRIIMLGWQVRKPI